MNTSLLIDAILGQMAILVSRLATVSGVRAPLAHVTDEVFLGLARALAAQGVSRRVAGDMLGVPRRTYSTKVQRLAQTTAHRKRTLWQGVLAYLDERGPASRKRLFDHFEQDDPESIGAVLNDLLRSGLVERVPSPTGTKFGVVSARAATGRKPTRTAIEALVWVAIYRGAWSEAEVMSKVGLDPTDVAKAVDALRAHARVSEERGRLTAVAVTLPVGGEHGWEASVFDHYQAVVGAIACKVSKNPPRSGNEDVVGGATLTFELHRDHPLRGEVLSLLERTRGSVNDLLVRVNDENRRGAKGAVSVEKVSFYFGQVTGDGEKPKRD